MKTIDELLQIYSEEIKKLREEKENCSNVQNFHYLEGRITSLEVVLCDMSELIEGRTSTNKKERIECQICHERMCEDPEDNICYQCALKLI